MKLRIPVDTQRIKALALPLEQALGKALDHYARLSPRERAIVASGSAFVAVFILLAGIIAPLIHYQASLEKSVAARDAELRKIYTMSATIRGLQQVAKTAPGAGGKQFTLFGFLEELAASLSINDRIEYMKPVTDSSEAGHESVEVKIRGLFQEDLIGLLFGIESTPYPVKIKHLTIRRQDKDGNIDVTLQVVSYG
ncbi:MAG TPA: type II secretion system protein GspM [Deltaproteobacteria bacterium]|nr:type II secretion system protein GspM [Deltaproteobacteria bacterium]HQI81611.1 type II secretion system protein GspM [Deltaproteobacteria bacterium]